MSDFFLFSPEPSEIDVNEETPTELPKSSTFSETITPESIQNHGNKPVLPKRKRRPRKPHPTYADMIDEALYNKGAPRKGISLYAVKKFLQEKYELYTKYAASRIRLVIKDALEKGRYVKTTGRGLNGCFRLASNTRRTLNNKYAERPSKSQRIILKTSQLTKPKRQPLAKTKNEAILNKRSNQNNRNLLKGNLKRKASPVDVPKADEIKKARTRGPAIMRVSD